VHPPHPHPPPTGIDDPYEEPTHPEVTLEAYGPSGSQRDPTELARELLVYLGTGGFLESGGGGGGSSSGSGSGGSSNESETA